VPDVKGVPRPQRRAHRTRRQAPDVKAARTPPAAVCSRLASLQDGVVTHAQLLDAGLTRDEIRQLIRMGFLHRVYRGVYIVGHLALSPLAKERAAVLACGPRSVISHRSAAYLWGLIDERSSTTSVTMTGRACRNRAGLRLHEVARLSSADIRTREGIRLTSPARTIVDLAAEADDHELEGLIAKARVKRLVRDGELDAAVARAGKRRGVARLRALLRTHAGKAMTRSEIERRCRRLLKAAGLPQPGINRRVAGYEVDFLWPEHRVILEVDSITFHGHARAFEWDRRKTMALQDAGYYVIRVTRRQLVEEPYSVIAHITRALERHPPGGGFQTNVPVLAGANA
jgi:very-short-patch-repair endonuclease